MLNKRGRFFLFLLIAILVVIVIWMIPWPTESKGLGDEPSVWGGQKLVTADHVEDYIKRFLSASCKKRKEGPGRDACIEVTLNQKRARRAPKLAAMIDRIADERGVDPLVVAVVVDHESSFYEKIRDGKDGEQGLMQVHGQVLKKALSKGYDMKTSEGQLSAGTDELKRCQEEECDGSLVGTLSCYQAGNCKTSAFGPKVRTRKVKRERSKIGPILVARAGPPAFIAGM